MGPFLKRSINDDVLFFSRIVRRPFRNFVGIRISESLLLEQILVLIRIIILEDDIEWKKWEDIVSITWKNVKCPKKYIFTNVYPTISCISWRKSIKIHILEIINLSYTKFDACISIALKIIIHRLKRDNSSTPWNHNKESNSGLSFLSCTLHFKL